MYHEAIAEAAEALKIESFLPSAYFITGMAHMYLGETDEAVSSLKKTLFIDKDYAIARFYLASIYNENGQSEKAMVEFKRTLSAIENNPKGNWRIFAGGYDNKVLMEASMSNLNALGIKA
jgi:tetratricopeptide (TPR) repeat protein